MNEESRDKKKIFEIISKNRLLFAFAGSIVAIIAVFTPMFHFDWYNHGFREYGSLWIFGLYEYSFFTHAVEWFGVTEAVKVELASISIVSTVVVSALVLGTIITASYTLIRKRKKGVYSSRLILYFSIGLFIAVNSYMYAIFVSANLLSTDLFWLSTPVLVMIGPILFILGSILILLGYTVKIKVLLKILSLFAVAGFITYGAINLTRFFVTIAYAASLGAPLNPNAVLFQFNLRGTPAVIAFICALAIIIMNYVLYRRAKRRASLSE